MDRRTWVGALGVFAAAIVFYVHVVQFGFVYDDHWTIEANHALGGSLRPLLSAALQGQAHARGIPDATRPVMIGSMWIDRHLFGLDHPGAWHAHSLVLHALVSVSVGLLLLVLTERRRLAFFGALFFAVAPVHGEVVAALNYREDLLSTLGVVLVLAGLFASRGERERDPISFAAVLAVLFAFALLAKESAVVLVPLVAALAVILRVDRAWLRVREPSLLGLGAVLFVFVNWRFALGHGDDVPRAASRSWVESLFATARFETKAVISSLLPFEWSPEHSRLPPASWVWLVALGVLIGVVVFAARRAHLRCYALGLTFALIAPLAASPIVGPINELADRYFYLAVAGGALVFGALVDDVLQLAPRARTATLSVASLALVLLGWQSWNASGVFRDDRTLWTSAVEGAPDSPRAWVGVSRVHRLDGDLDQADIALARALELDPSYKPAQLTLAYNLIARGRMERALQVLDALERHGDMPGLRHAHECLLRKPDEARVCAQTAP